MSRVYTEDELRTLFVPPQGIPLPEWVPPRARTPGNLFNAYSPKLGRQVFLSHALEFDYWKKIEGDPQVIWYCEHSPKAKVDMGERIVTTIFDMQVCRVGNKLSLVEVKSEKDLEPEPGSRIWWQLEAQQIYSRMNNIPYEILTEKKIRKNMLFLNNWFEIVGYLTDRPPFRLMTLVLHYLDERKSCPLRDLICKFIRFEDSEAVKRAVFFLLHKGFLQAPLDCHPLDLALPIYVCES